MLLTTTTTTAGENRLQSGQKYFFLPRRSPAGAYLYNIK